MSANSQAEVAMVTVDAGGELGVELVDRAVQEILLETRDLTDSDLLDLGRVILAMKLGLFPYTAEQIEAWTREERCRVIAALPLPDMCEAA